MRISIQSTLFVFILFGCDSNTDDSERVYLAQGQEDRNISRLEKSIIGQLDGSSTPQEIVIPGSRSKHRLNFLHTDSEILLYWAFDDSQYILSKYPKDSFTIEEIASLAASRAMREVEWQYLWATGEKWKRSQIK